MGVTNNGRLSTLNTGRASESCEHWKSCEHCESVKTWDLSKHWKRVNTVVNIERVSTQLTTGRVSKQLQTREECVHDNFLWAIR